MSLTDQDFLRFSELIDVKFKGLDAKFERIDRRFDQLEGRMERLEGRMERLEGRMERLENRVGHLEERVVKLEGRVDAVEGQNRSIKLLLENELIPRVKHLEQCYVSAHEDFEEKSQRIDSLEMDVDVMKKVVREHSAQLQKLA